MKLGVPAVRRGTVLLACLALTAAITGTSVGGPAAPASAATVTAPLGIAAGGILPWLSQSERDAYFAKARDLGATWLRFDVTWNDIQRDGPGSYSWSRYDTVVADAQRHGLQVLGLIGYAPRWAQSTACAGQNVCAPRSATEYGDFAGAVAQHYASRGVHHWEIWNEPNVPQFFAPAPDPALYTAMLTAAHRRIHAADPKAVVIAAGAAPAATSGGGYSPAAFLEAMYAHGAKGRFDALGSHPYCFAGAFDCPNQKESWNAWSQMAQTSPSLRGVLTARGDGRIPIWATEYGAPTKGSQAVTEAHQATMLTDGLRSFGGYDWSGPLFVHTLRDLGTNTADREHWFGLIRYDGSAKPAFGAVRSLLRSSTQRTVPGVAAAPAAPGAGNGAGSGTTSGPGATTSPAVPSPTVEPTLVPAVTAAAPRATPAPTVPPAAPPAARKHWWDRLVEWIFD